LKKIVTALAFLRRDDEILLAMKKRGMGQGRWNGAGGKQDQGETIEQAMVRECQEEIGVTPLSFHKVAYHVFTLNADTEKPFQILVHTYLVREWQGEPAESEEMAPKWFKITDIPYDDMWQDDAYWLPQVLDGKLIESDITFDANDRILTQKINEITSFST
jgi:mutator protein MutT